MAHPDNVIKAWKGAVEPAELSPSGNEIKLWKGAVEPTGIILNKSATVSVIGGQNLSDLSYVVFDGYDVSVAPILKQGFGESTDGAGELVVDLNDTGVNHDDPVSIVITDYTVSPGPSNKAAVCHTTAVVA